MATRLTSRLSAGAALVTGLGMLGIAAAVPAQAATTMQFTCTTPLGDQVFDVMLDTDLPESVATGEEVSITPSGTVTLNPATANGLAGFLGWEYVSGDLPDVTATLSTSNQSIAVPTDLSIPKTHIFDADNGGWTQDDTPDLPIEGTSATAEAGPVGEYILSAPSTFEAVFHGYDAEGAPTGDPIASTCTYLEDSGSLVIDTLTVTDEPIVEEPTEPPTAEEPTEPPAAEEPTEPPAAEEPTEPPAAEEPTEPAPTTPEVPEVVQTDGLTPTMTTQQDSSGALALGGLLLAGAGAGTVLVARRRGQQH